MRYPHQTTGTDFLKKKLRAICADDMGLGKTLEALDAVEGMDRVLFICLNSSKFTWANEIKQWYPEASYTIVGAKNKYKYSVADQAYIKIEDAFDLREEQIKRQTTFTIINYALIGSVTEWGVDESTGKKVKVSVDDRHLKTLSKIRWKAVIIDEAHNLRNRKS